MNPINKSFKNRKYWNGYSPISRIDNSFIVDWFKCIFHIFQWLVKLCDHFSRIRKNQSIFSGTIPRDLCFNFSNMNGSSETFFVTITIGFTNRFFLVKLEIIFMITSSRGRVETKWLYKWCLGGWTGIDPVLDPDQFNFCPVRWSGIPDQIILVWSSGPEFRTKLS